MKPKFGIIFKSLGLEDWLEIIAFVIGVGIVVAFGIWMGF